MTRAADGNIEVTIPKHVLHQLTGAGDWVSSWWVAAIVLAMSLVCLWIALRRRKRGTRAWPMGAGAVIALALGMLLGVNSDAGYVPNIASLRITLSSWGIGSPPPPVQGRTTGAAADDEGGVASRIIPAPAGLKMPDRSLTWVYTPPGYDSASDVRYPVAYLIHGEPGRSGDWFAAGDVARTMDVLIASHSVVPMIVVAADVNGVGPSGLDTECLDSDRGGSQVETYLNTVVVPWIDAHYATDDDPEDRAIGGFSSGGYCALDQGLRHPQTFGTVLSLSGFTDPGAGGDAMLSTRSDWNRHDVARYAASLPARSGRTQNVFVSVAAEDDEDGVRKTFDVARELRAHGYPVATRDVRGYDHSWVYARAELPYALVFFSEALTGSLSG